MLVGKVGSGKTCLARFLQKKFMRAVYPNSISVYFDLRGLPENNESSLHMIEKRFYKSVLDSLQSIFTDINECQFLAEVLKIRGYGDVSSEFILSEGINIIDVDMVIDYLFQLEEVDHLLIIMDNIDENYRSSVQAGDSFGLQICDMLQTKVENLRDEGIHKYGCILVPVRDYTINYFSTSRFAIKTLDPLDLLPVMSEKIISSRSESCV